VEPGVRLELVLYIARSDKSQRALRSIRRVMNKYDQSQVRLTIRRDSVAFAPALVTRGSVAATWILGNLEQDDLLIDLFDGNGVDRKRDGH